MVTSPPPPTSRRRSSLLPMRPQTSHVLQSYSEQLAPPRTSHSHVPPLPRSPSIEAFRRLDQVFSTIESKRSFEPSSSRWSTHFRRHGYAVDTPEEGLSVHTSQPESSAQAPITAQTPYQHIQHLPYHEFGYGTHQTAASHRRRESTSTTAAGTAHNFLSQAKSLVRRASTTLGGQPSQKHRRGSNTNNRLDIPEETIATSSSSYHLARPATSYPEYLAESSIPAKSNSAKRPSFLKRMRSFRSRRDAVSNAPGLSYPESTFLYPLHSSPNLLSAQPVHQFDWPRPGAAARASAAAAATTSTMPLPPQLPAAGSRPALLTRKDTKCSRATKAVATEYVETTKRADTAMEVDSVMEPAEERLGKSHNHYICSIHLLFCIGHSYPSLAARFDGQAMACVLTAHRLLCQCSEPDDERLCVVCSYAPCWGQCS